MRIISVKMLRQFWDSHPAAWEPLQAWRRVVRRTVWRNFAELGATYAHADQVGRFVVFNVGGNKYRLVTAIHFNRGIVYVRQVLTHREYDKGKWKSE